MGIAERKERERQQRMDMILDAAEEVFLDKGLRNATMDEIAEKAELSKATLYLYFKAKELLYVGIKIRATVKLAEYFTRAIEGKASGWEKTRAILEVYYKFAQEQPVYFRSMSNFERVDPELIEKYYDEDVIHGLEESGLRVLSILADVIQEGIDDGTMRGDLEPLKTAIFLWATSNGIIQLHMYRATGLANYGGYDRDFLLEEFDRHIKMALASGKGSDT